MDAIKLLGSLMGNNATGGNLLGSLLGGATGGGSSAGGGGLGSIVGSLLGGGGGAANTASAGAGAGGLGSILGGLLGGGGGGGNAASGALGALTGGQRQQADDQATVLIRAMVNAAKADGQVDQDEIQNIVARLGGDVDEAEAAFLKQELQAPLDIDGYCRAVPQELSQQAYAFSVMGMKLDTKQEAQYLGAMAQGLGLNAQVCNAIHDKLGAPQIFG